MKTSKRVIRRRRGFTLLEVLMVIVILGILVAVVGGNLFGAGERARVDAAKLAISGMLSQKVDLFRMHTGQNPEDLNQLFEKPDDEELAAKWGGPYLEKKSLKDPWGEDYQYESESDSSSKGYMLGSKGPDKQWGTDDDITNADK